MKLIVLMLCVGVAVAQRLNDQRSSGSALSGNNNFDRFGSSGSSGDRFSPSSDRFGSSGSSGSDRFGSSGSNSDRFGSSGSNSDRFGSSGSNSDRFGSSGSNSDRFGSGSNNRDDRFPLTKGTTNFDSGSGDWDSDTELDSQRIQAWPGGIVPYEISSDIADSDAKNLKSTLDFVSQKTCVQFVTRARNDANYTLFKSGNVCSAPLGMSTRPTPSDSRSGSFGSSSSDRNSFGSSSRGGSSSSRDRDDQRGGSGSRGSGVSGASTVVLAPKSCFQTKRLARRILNLLGIPHETSRPDRDQFVTINFNNIRSGYTNNLKQLSASAYLPGVLDVPYDLQSVSQYSDSDIAKDKNTWAIKPKSSRSSARDLGGDDFSQADFQKINAAYNCRQGGRNSGSGGLFGSSSGSGGRGRN